MIILLSPSKTIQATPGFTELNTTLPDFIKEADSLVKNLKKLPFKPLQEVLNASPALTQKALDFYSAWNNEHSTDNSCMAIHAFRGDVYNGLKAAEWKNDTLLYSQDRIRIFSGLYGIVRPLDLIQNYRLDVANKFRIREKSLYQYWQKKVTSHLTEAIKKDSSPTFVNLASQEYFTMPEWKKIRSRVITPVFMEKKEDGYKVVSLHAKTARGLMTRFIMENRIENPAEMVAFDLDRYQYRAEMSNEHTLIFTR